MENKDLSSVGTPGADALGVPSPSLADEPANRQASAFDVAGLAERLGEAAEWLRDELPENVREIQHLEGDVTFDEMNLYCVNLMVEASKALAKVAAARVAESATIAIQAGVIEQMKRALPDCIFCAGTGQIEHDAVCTGPNPHNACVESCDACDGLGVRL